MVHKQETIILQMDAKMAERVKYTETLGDAYPKISPVREHELIKIT